MINFKNDYSTIAHPRILEAMVKYNDNTYVGYGLDTISDMAKVEIKKYISRDVDIYFLVGGTSANKTVISHSLRSYEAVISVKTGHICVHETGAIEATGHRIIEVEGVDGKMLPSSIETVIKTHTDEHMVLPKMVYITQATELGTLYTKEELINIYNMCKKYNLYLFLDGARLAVALDKSDITLDDLANYTDVYYIGGTKNGAMLGEAVIISNEEIKKCFRFSIKQNGGMYAKGFVAGIQFYELFKDDLYFKLGEHSNKMAQTLAVCLINRGFTLAQEQVTNQIFVKVSNKLYEKLYDFVLFELWEDLGTSKVIRLVTNYSTTHEDIYSFCREIDKIISKKVKLETFLQELSKHYEFEIGYNDSKLLLENIRKDSKYYEQVNDHFINLNFEELFNLLTENNLKYEHYICYLIIKSGKTKDAFINKKESTLDECIYWSDLYKYPFVFVEGIDSENVSDLYFYSGCKSVNYEIFNNILKEHNFNK